MQTRRLRRLDRDAIRPPDSPSDRAASQVFGRRINVEIAGVARMRLACAKMRFFGAVIPVVIAVACTLFWLCASISVYESDFSELENFEIIFFLLTMLGLAEIVALYRLTMDRPPHGALLVEQASQGIARGHV